MMTDPIADLLTRIRNSVAIKGKRLRIPYTKLKEQIVDVLQREGYVASHSKSDSKPEDGMGPQGWLHVELKYGEEDEDVIAHIKRISRPGRRVYSQARDLKPVLNGLGIRILSTSRGILSDREAQKNNVGGEILAEVY